MTSAFEGNPQPPASLTAEPERFSDQAWDLLLSSQDVARRWRHGDLDVEHLLQVLFADPRYQAEVAALSLPRDRLLDRLETFLAEQPTAAARTCLSGRILNGCWIRRIVCRGSGALA